VLVELQSCFGQGNGSGVPIQVDGVRLPRGIAHEKDPRPRLVVRH
jgi:hypothetical protein